MKIGYINESAFRAESFGDTVCGEEIQVIRLPDVDMVIAEAVWAMEQLQTRIRTGYFSVWGDHDFPPKDKEIEELVQKDPDYQRAQAFLASQVVIDWRKRQKEGAS